MITHATSSTTAVANTNAAAVESAKLKRPRKTPTRTELGRALEHADLIAPPDDSDLHYLTPGIDAQRMSARALGALAAEVRSLHAELRTARRRLKAGAR